MQTLFGNNRFSTMRLLVEPNYCFKCHNGHFPQVSLGKFSKWRYCGSHRGKVTPFNRVFPKKNGTASNVNEFGESDKSLKHELMSVKDLFCYQCPRDTEVQCWFFIQEISRNSTTFSQSLHEQIRC